MELRHLRYFIAVAEEQNVTHAAARLHVSQPPLTRQIQDLEHELGVKLFERTGRSIRLSVHGRAFLDEARQILGKVDDAISRVRRMDSHPRGEIHLGYAPTPTQQILPSILSAVKTVAPRLAIRLHDLSSPEMLAGLRRGTLDAALMVQPVQGVPKGIEFQALASFRILAAVPTNHTYRGRREISLEELLEEPIVAYGRKQFPDYHKMLKRVVGKNRNLPIAEECDSGTSLIAAVQSGRGVAITAESLKATAGEKIKFIKLRGVDERIVVGIAIRKSGNNRIGRWLMDLASEKELQGLCFSVSQASRAASPNSRGIANGGRNS
jgi:DNA-binding transcriptional LysR family regulator